MNINQLKYILAIKDQQHITRAADKCCVAQPTLSRELQKLEKELDIMIFDRSRSPIVPTAKGEKVLVIAKEILHKIKELENCAKDENDIYHHTFNLGVWTCLAPYFLPFFLKLFADKYPNIRFNIFELNLIQLQKKLHNNSLDACITYSFKDQSGYYESKLYDETFFAYTSLKGNTCQLERKDVNFFHFHKLILQYDFESILKEINYNGFETHKDFSIDLSYQNGSIETIRKIIQINGGTTILPSVIINKHDKNYINHLMINQQLKVTLPIKLVSPRFFEKKELLLLIKKELKNSFRFSVN